MNVIGTHRRLFSALALVALCGCRAPQPPAEKDGSGARVLSRDGRRLYVVDSQENQLLVLDRRSLRRAEAIAVGAGPEHVLEASDGTLYVSNRADRSVSVIPWGARAEATRLPVGLEPVGLALSADGAVLYVVNGQSQELEDQGAVTAIDTRSQKTLWSIPVGKDPRGIRLLPGDRAEVSFYRRPETLTLHLARTESSGPSFAAGGSH